MDFLETTKKKAFDVTASPQEDDGTEMFELLEEAKQVNGKLSDTEVIKKKYNHKKKSFSTKAADDPVTDLTSEALQTEDDSRAKHSFKSVASNLLSHWAVSGKGILGRTNKLSGKYEDVAPESDKVEESTEELDGKTNQGLVCAELKLSNKSKQYAQSQRTHFSRVPLWKYLAGIRHLNSWDQNQQTRLFNRLFKHDRAAKLRETCWKKAIGNELHITQKLYEVLKEKVYALRKHILQVSQRYRSRLEHTLGPDSLEDVTYLGQAECPTCLQLWCPNTISAFETISVDLHRTLPRLGILLNTTNSCFMNLDQSEKTLDDNKTLNTKSVLLTGSQEKQVQDMFYENDSKGNSSVVEIDSVKRVSADKVLLKSSKDCSKNIKQDLDEGVVLATKFKNKTRAAPQVSNNENQCSSGGSFVSETSSNVSDNEVVSTAEVVNSSFPENKTESNDSKKKNSFTSSQVNVSQQQDDEEFDMLEMYSRLRLILEMFVLFRPDIGYVQGMAYLAAIFLFTIKSPFDAFVCFSNLLFRESLNAFYTFDVQKIKAYFYIFDILLKEKLPEVSQFLCKEQIPSSQFLTDWMYTIFTRSLPLNILVKVWDLFLLKGDPVLFQVSLTVLNHSFKQLNFSNEDLSTLTSTTSMLQKLDSFKKDVFFQESANFQISTDKFRHLLQEAHEQTADSDLLLNKTDFALDNPVDNLAEEDSYKKLSEGVFCGTLQKKSSSITTLNSVTEKRTDVQCDDEDTTPQTTAEHTQGLDVSSGKKKKMFSSIIFRLQHQAIKPFLQDPEKKNNFL